MNFIFTSFLWLLPLVSIPLLIHIFNKMNIRTIEFSSIQFLKLIESDSINKLKLLQILLLIIRTLIILFIILMLSRPVINGLFQTSLNNSDSILSIIYIDDTASNNGKIDQVDREDILNASIQEILSQINDNSTMIILTQSEGLLYNGLKKSLSNIFPIKISNSNGKMYDRLNFLKNYTNREYANTELFIISDGEKSIFNKIELIKDKLKDIYIYFIQLPNIDYNYAITDVDILNENIIINSPITFNVKVKNTGLNTISNALLELKIDDINVGQQLISLDAKEHKKFTFTTSLPSSGKHKCYLTIPNDNNNNDNTYYFMINIPRNLDIIAFSNNIYIKEILNSINNNTKNLNINFKDQSNINFTNYDIAIISSSLSINKSSLLTYIEGGGHVIFFPDKADIEIPDYINNILPDNLINKLVINKNSFNMIDSTSLGLSFIKNNSNFDNSNNLEFYKYIPLIYNNNSMLRLGDGYSIWNRYLVKNGLFDIFGFSNDLNWTNLPLKGSYATFMNKLIYSKLNYNKNNIYVGNIWEPIIHTSNLSDVLVFTSDSNNEEIINNNSPKIKIEEKGFLKISNSKNAIIEIASNIDTEELTNITKNKNEIISLFGTNFIYIDKDITASIESNKYGYEIWRIFLYLVILLIIIEMIISNSKRFQKD